MVLSRFELLEIVARGGMGVVWKARHLDSGEVVAIKVLSMEGAGADRLVHALHAEVAAMAGLRAGICIMAVPTLIFSVCASIQAAGLTASEP